MLNVALWKFAPLQASVERRSSESDRGATTTDEGTSAAAAAISYESSYCKLNWSMPWWSAWQRAYQILACLDQFPQAPTVLIRSGLITDLSSRSRLVAVGLILDWTDSRPDIQIHRANLPA
ncbi:hypothetical protein Dimus_034953 [Dionaea muscipula]